MSDSEILKAAERIKLNREASEFLHRARNYYVEHILVPNGSLAHVISGEKIFSVRKNNSEACVLEFHGIRDKNWGMEMLDEIKLNKKKSKRLLDAMEMVL